VAEQLVAAGCHSLGESRPQALWQKAEALAGSPTATSVRWHMIGHLQRNKARKVVDCTRLIHSVDSLRLAEELQLIAHKREQVIEVLLQVNLSGVEGDRKSVV